LKYTFEEVKSKSVERVAKPYERDEKKVRKNFFQKEIGSSQLINVEGSFNFYMATFSKGEEVCGRAKRRGDGEVHERNRLSVTG
jgi:hypothetical protein